MQFICTNCGTNHEKIDNILLCDICGKEICHWCYKINPINNSQLICDDCLEKLESESK